MKRLILHAVPALFLLMLLFQGQTVHADNENFECQKFSDTFESYDINKWADVTLLSKSQGIVYVKNGKLVLKAPEQEPCEIQVYSLFTFEGDFDVQSDYDISYSREKESCRFNAGIVMQTLGDEKSYKTYVAVNPGKNPFFKARVDSKGEKNIEKHKGMHISLTGSFRVIRKNNIISSYKKEQGNWHLVYQFNTPCPEKLRMRFKLQTGDANGPDKEACPVLIKFDNFKVNSCTSITAE
ncbi:MAG: hypothetical protein GXP56_12525 [Deltaproteobacteria bacterium]|nr:hypothetical protein [Deltaproteobacteria bacterium]